MIGAAKIRTQAEWMAANIDKLVEAIRADGKIGGPASDPLLDQCARYSSQSRVAKHMLYQRLRKEGMGNAISELDESP